MPVGPAECLDTRNLSQVASTATINREPLGRASELLSRLDIENKIKEGAENLLQVFDAREVREGQEELRQQAESQLDAANARIAILRQQLQSQQDDRLESSPVDSYSNHSNDNTNTTNTTNNNNNNNNNGPRSEDLDFSSPLCSFHKLLQSIEKSLEFRRLVDRSNELVDLLQRYPLLKYELSMTLVRDKIQHLLLHREIAVVACGYRLARYTITDVKSVQSLQQYYIDVVLLKSLAKDPSFLVERLQAVKFVRAVMDISRTCPDLVAVAVVRALVAISESEDNLRNLALETLAELLVVNVKVVAQTGGVRALLQTVIDGPRELSGPISMLFTFVLDDPNTREILRNGRDLECLISAFTEFQTKTSVNIDRLQNSAKILSAILRTWSGFAVFCADDFRCLRGLVQCLMVPIAGLRDCALDMFFSLLRIRPLSWSSSYLAGRRLTTLGKSMTRDLSVTNLQMSSATYADCKSSDFLCSNRFSDHFTAILLTVLLHCGLIDALVHILQDTSDPTNSRKASLLLGETLHLATGLLSRETVQNISTLPTLFDRALTADSPSVASVASGALFQIDKITRSLQKTHSAAAAAGAGPAGAGPAGTASTAQSSTLLSTTLRSEDGTFEFTKPYRLATAKSPLALRQKLRLQIDDFGFKQLLMDTQVLATKSYIKWNWDALAELIQGPLLNPRRLDEAIKTPKFMKRLTSFYRPFKYRFSSIKRTKPNQRYVYIGQLLFDTLLQSPEGVKYLTENKLLRQIAECLAQLDKMSGITSAEPLFSSQRLQNTLSYGYFELLGVLSADRNGLAMMERWRMFNMIYHLSELRHREDLIISFIGCMDYRHLGHHRIILAKTLTSGSHNVRLFATNHLRTLINLKDVETRQWCINLLLTQLYDTSLEVCKLSVYVLDEFCENLDNLEYFVQLKPALDHLGDVGAPLLMRFLSTSTGFRYLKEIDYIEFEMDNWFHGLNEQFAAKMEEHLEKSHRKWILGNSTAYTTPSSQTGVTSNFRNLQQILGVIGDSHEHYVEKQNGFFLPRHFYGELTLTDEGFQLLQSKGHFDNFVHYIKRHGLEANDKDVISKLKGNLWAVGHICKNPKGALFTECSDVMETVLHVARFARVCSVKGTAIYVLGLFSSTIDGMEILDELGWESVLQLSGDPKGICLPMDISVFSIHETGDPLPSRGEEPAKPALDVDFVRRRRSQTDPIRKLSRRTSQDLKAGVGRSNSLAGDSTGLGVADQVPADSTIDKGASTDGSGDHVIVQKIMLALSNLSNQLLANKASMALVRLKSNHQRYFKDPAIFLQAMDLLQRYRYRQPVRRFIFELFDVGDLIYTLIDRDQASRTVEGPYLMVT